MGPVLASLCFVVAGCIYVFRWGSLGQHTPGVWISPADLWITYYAASELAHGHFADIYRANVSFVEFPGILLVLAPLGALSGSFHTAFLEVSGGQVVAAQGVSAHAVGIPFLNAQEFHDRGVIYVTHPQWVTVVDPVAILLASSALFGFDALAERLGVSARRRLLLVVAEAILLWNVTLWWGHPEDAVALCLASYSMVMALDGRFTRAGWLAGAAVAFQPLVLLVLPVLVAAAGRRSGVGVVVRAMAPAAVLLTVPFLASPRATWRAVVEQPSKPNVNHATPWTALSPGLGGHGASATVAAGPLRAGALIIAVGLGIWAYHRLRSRPAMLVWACAVGLALRSGTESVMTDYYAWAALALAVVVAARGSMLRFVSVSLTAVAVTVLAQWNLVWLPWWLIEMGGLGLVLVVAFPPAGLAEPTMATPGQRETPKPNARGRGRSEARSSSRRRTPGPTSTARGRPR